MPTYLNVLRIITFTNASQKIKFFSPNNLVFKLVIQLTTQLFNLIKYLKLLKITCLRRACLLTIQKAFGRVHHMILLKRLELNAIRVNNRNWIRSSVKDKTMYRNRIHNQNQFGTSDSSRINISPSLISFYVNDLKNASIAFTF